jgi:methylmalonyl-CoA mutase N-terminal domain/subunit
MDEILQELQREIAKLRVERDLWHARAIAMFWRLPDDTMCSDLRADAEKALAMLRS